MRAYAAIYSELATERESATITCLLERGKADWELGKLYSDEKGRLQGCSDERVWHGEAGGGLTSSRQGALCGFAEIF